MKTTALPAAPERKPIDIAKLAPPPVLQRPVPPALERKQGAARPERHLAAIGRGLKAVADKPGLVEGYGSVFGIEDSYGDVVAPGAFKDSIAAWKAKGRMPAMLWQHNSDQPIGTWTDVEEDAVGLKCTGQLLLAVPGGEQAYEHLKAGTINGLSIGFQTVERSWNSETDVRTLLKIDLWEVSLVTFPANDSARVQSVKAALGIRTIRQFEDFLRDAGFSVDAAKAIAARGFKAKPDPRDEDGSLADVSAALKRATELFKS